jgi:hypothetical protein
MKTKKSTLPNPKITLQTSFIIIVNFFTFAPPASNRIRDTGVLPDLVCYLQIIGGATLSGSRVNH